MTTDNRLKLEVGKVYRDVRQRELHGHWDGFVELKTIEPSWLYAGQTWCIVLCLDGWHKREGRFAYILPEHLVPICQRCRRDLPEGHVCDCPPKQLELF